MELFVKENQTYNFHCAECGLSIKRLVTLNDNDYCESCLIKAVLMVRPIAWHKGLINGILDNKLETTKYLSDGKAIDLVKFIEWLKPFLESK